MRDAAPDASDDRIAALDELIRDARNVHDLGGQDKERDGQRGEPAESRKGPLDQDERGLAEGVEQHDDRGKSDRVGHGDRQEDQSQHEQQEQQSHGFH